MKKIITLLLVAIMVSSCSKKDVTITPVKEKLEANITFTVVEQINTVKYVIESSIDSKTFIPLTIIDANNMSSYTYGTDIDVTNLFSNSVHLVYLRVKSLDSYNTANYSSIIKIYDK